MYLVIFCFFFMFLSCLSLQGFGKLAVMGSSHIFNDQYIDKEENSKILVCGVNFSLIFIQDHKQLCFTPLEMIIFLCTLHYADCMMAQNYRLLVAYGILHFEIARSCLERSKTNFLDPLRNILEAWKHPEISQSMQKRFE